jgi:osmotically-inducible protein OsmY
MNNQDLQKDIQDALKWDPALKDADITVQAKDGFITFSGCVKSYQDKVRAEAIVKSVFGVKALIEHLTVVLDPLDEVSDDSIAQHIFEALKLTWVPYERIRVKVENGHVTVEGQVTYNFQKETANKSVVGVKGVKVLTNHLTLLAESHEELEKKSIEKALSRYAATVDQNINVQVDGTSIELTGTVKSFYEKEEAEKITWNAPGVTMVINELVIE